MFMILAPRAVPLGPPKFTHVKDSAVEAAAKKDAEEEAADAARAATDAQALDSANPSDSANLGESPAHAVPARTAVSETV